RAAGPGGALLGRAEGQGCRAESFAGWRVVPASRWRIILLVGLIAVPVVFLMGMGLYFLWQNGWAFYAWWPMAACLGAAYLLGWYWQRQQRLLGPPVVTPPLHWTERDQQAWNLVEARASA